MEKLLTSIFGECCYFCGRAGRIICHSCLSKIRLCRAGVCIKCQQETVLGTTHLLCQNETEGGLPSQLCAVYEYGGLVSEIIKKSKYSPKRFALLRLLSAEGAKMASKFGYDFAGFTVVPVPISRAREKERGFNQAEIIARPVAKEFGLAVDNSVLTRIRDTNKQFGLHRDERAQNIAGAFEVKRAVLNQKSGATAVGAYNAVFTKANIYPQGPLSGRKFLLVDDICTTGSTLISASTALFSAGAQDVRCFALSRKL